MLFCYVYKRLENQTNSSHVSVLGLVAFIIKIYLSCSTSFEQSDNRSHGIASYNRIINQHHSLSCKVFIQWSIFLGNTQLSQTRSRLYKCSSNIGIFAQHFSVLNTHLQRKDHLRLFEVVLTFWQHTCDTKICSWFKISCNFVT